MKIYLLTHEREIGRPTNTGSLAINGLNNIVERIVWERTKPNKELVHLLESNEALLLYSKGDGACSSSAIDEYENIIIIDGTWQESQKIFNKSAYLKNAPQLTLNITKGSSYKLRRNQPEGGLCTVECVVEVLRMKGQDAIAEELEVKFKQFNGSADA